VEWAGPPSGPQYTDPGAVNRALNRFLLGSLSLVSSHSFVSSSAAAMAVTASPRLHDCPGPLCSRCRRTRDNSHTQPPVHGARQGSSARHANKVWPTQWVQNRRRTRTASAGAHSTGRHARWTRTAPADAHGTGWYARHRRTRTVDTHGTAGHAQHRRTRTASADAHDNGGRVRHRGTGTRTARMALVDTLGTG
jgi:hypothetical protein